MSSRVTAADVAIDVLAGIALGLGLVLIWVHTWVVVQALATVAALLVILWIYATRWSQKTLVPRAPEFRAPRGVRRDTITDPVPETNPADDYFDGVDTGLVEEPVSEE